MSDVSGTFDAAPWATDQEGEDTHSQGFEPDLYDPQWTAED